jgi:hypothetical protein
MSLESKLSEIRDASSKRIPDAARDVMQGAIKALREAGIIENAIHTGDKLPAFSLVNQDGVTVESSDLLKKGAVVLTVFRGHW